MSRETLAWLNENTLIGFTDKRGAAWHGRKGDDNHYPGAIPVEDVRKRLFSWTAEEAPIYAGLPDREFDGLLTTVEVPNRKAIVRSDTGTVLGIHTDSYQIHQYNEWLVNNIETILDDSLQIGTAGLLRGGAVAWVQVEVPETIVTPEGVSFRPFLLASTSLDGSIATSYGRSVTNTVCDNTMSVAMTQHGGQRIRYRHSSKSLGRIQEARDALGIIYTAADEFTQEVATLTSIGFSSSDFERLLNIETPLPDPKKAPGPYSKAVERREFLWDMYRFDVRCAPWTGTAFGAWQTFNTFRQHENQLRKGAIRTERNMWRTVKGAQQKEDTDVLSEIMELAS